MDQAHRRVEFGVGTDTGRVNVLPVAYISTDRAGPIRCRP